MKFLVGIGLSKVWFYCVTPYGAMIKFEKNILYLNGKELSFKFRVKNVLKFQTVIVVLLEVEPGNVENRNIYGLDFQGNRMWQVADISYKGQDSPFTAIRNVDGLLRASNWNDAVLMIDPVTGEILKKKYIR